MNLAEYNRRVHPSPVRMTRVVPQPIVRWTRVSAQVISRGKAIVLISLIASTLVPAEYATYVSALGGVYWLLKL